MWEIARKWCFLLLSVSVLLSFGNRNGETQKGFSSDASSSPGPTLMASSQSWVQPIILTSNDEKFAFDDSYGFLEYDFYRNSCPQVYQIIRSTIQILSETRPDVAPALLRLVFHDCFIEGCDASVLLDAINGHQAEKEVLPNETLKGFDIIEIIKSTLEEVCPETVSCADIIVLAAREGIVLAGGAFYPLYTGRRDSALSFPEVALYELPAPDDDLPETLASFASRGFDERETVSLLGAHSIGMIHCKFFRNRLYSFAGSGVPDPSLESEFLNIMRLRCNNSNNSSSPPSIPSSALPPQSSSEDPGMELNYEGGDSGFGTHYFRSLLQGRGILHADQQLMSSERTENWVRAYASDGSLFRRDFATVMMKLSNLRVLTAPLGLVRRNCSKIS